MLTGHVKISWQEVIKRVKVPSPISSYCVSLNSSYSGGLYLDSKRTDDLVQGTTNCPLPTAHIGVTYIFEGPVTALTVQLPL
jgi:hypothetical protein